MNAIRSLVGANSEREVCTLMRDADAINCCFPHHLEIFDRIRICRARFFAGWRFEGGRMVMFRDLVLLVAGIVFEIGSVSLAQENAPPELSSTSQGSEVESDEAKQQSQIVSLSIVSIEETLRCNVSNMRVGRLVEVVVELENRSGVNIELDSIVPSCGCTAAKISSSPLRIGEKIVLNVTTKPTELGNFDKPIFFYRKNDPSPVFVIRVTGEVLDPVKCNLPISVTLDKASNTAELDLEIEPNFDDVFLDSSLIMFTGELTDRSPKSISSEDRKFQARVSFRANDQSPMESVHWLKVGYKDCAGGTHVREYPIAVRKVPELSATPKKLVLTKEQQAQCLVRLALVGSFEKDKKTNVRIMCGKDLVGESNVLSLSDRIIGVRFVIGEESVVWKQTSGVLTFVIGEESVDVPFSFEE